VAKTFGEIGDSGLVRWSGMVESRYIADLYGTDGINTFEEMFRRDPSLRSFMYATRIMARKSLWEASAASDAGPDDEAAEFLQSCLEDMSHTMSDAVDNILSMLVHGWQWSEICYKRRAGSGGKHSSQFDDGRIGWRKWAPRKQTSWYKWEFDQAGGIDGMWQWPQGSRMIGQAVLLPIEKSLHFKTEPAQGDPEGVSLGEGCYETWYFLKNLLPVMGVGFERSFVGLPVFHWAEGVVPDSDDKAAVAAMGKGLRMGEKAFASIPSSIREFRLDSADNAVGGTILETIKYLRQVMLQSVLAEFVSVGVGEVGSFAGHKDKTDLFLMAINGILDTIEAILNRFAVPRLFEYNEFAGITSLPTLQHVEIRKTDLGELGAFVQAIANYIPFQSEDVLWVRSQAGMPLIEEAEAEEETPTPETGQDEEATDDTPAETEEDMTAPGTALAEFARMPESDPMSYVIGSVLEKRQQKLMDRLMKSPKMPPDSYWAEEEKELQQAILLEIERLAMAGAEAAAEEIGVV